MVIGWLSGRRAARGHVALSLLPDGQPPVGTSSGGRHRISLCHGFRGEVERVVALDGQRHERGASDHGRHPVHQLRSPTPGVGLIFLGKVEHEQRPFALLGRHRLPSEKQACTASHKAGVDNRPHEIVHETRIKLMGISVLEVLLTQPPCTSHIGRHHRHRDGQTVLPRHPGSTGVVSNLVIELEAIEHLVRDSQLRDALIGTRIEMPEARTHIRVVDR